MNVRQIDRVLLYLLKGITITSLLSLTLLISANIFVRFFPVASLHWFDEIIELLYAYLVFYGAGALWISQEHFSVGDWVEKRIKNRRAKYGYRAMTELLVVFFVVVFFYYSFKLTLLAQDVTNVFAIPKRILYSCLPVSGAIMMLYSIRNIAVEFVKLVKPGQERGNSSKSD